MKTWIETASYTIDYFWENEDRSSKGWFFKGNDHVGMIGTPWKTMQEAVREFIQWADDHQYEIKAILHHTNAFYARNWQTDNHSHWAWGYGYGFSSITGCTFVLQRTLEISDAEYDSRLQMRKTMRKIQKVLPQEEKELEEARKSRDAIHEEFEKIPREIQEKKRFLGGDPFYLLGEETYPSREVAEDVLAKRLNAKKADLEESEGRLAAAEQKVMAHKKELEEIERALSQPAE